MLGATSPCQLSTNASSIAYLLNRSGGDRRGIGWTTIAYIAGKTLVYAGVGLLVLLVGQGMQAKAVPAITVTRKALGPLMVMVGLAMLGVWRPRWSFGHALSIRLRARAQTGVAGAFLLGIAFAFAFCPTLGLLFFGFVIPMALASGTGPLYAGAFAVGTTFPLIIAAALLAVGNSAGWFEESIGRWEPWLRRVAAAIFLLAGINDTFLYWFI